MGRAAVGRLEWAALALAAAFVSTTSMAQQAGLPRFPPHFTRNAPVAIAPGHVDLSFSGFLEFEAGHSGQMAEVYRSLEAHPDALPPWVLYSVAKDRWEKDDVSALNLVELGIVRETFAYMRCRTDRPRSITNPVDDIQRGLFRGLFRTVSTVTPESRADSLEWALARSKVFDDDATAAELCGFLFGERDFSDRARLEASYVVPKAQWRRIAMRVAKGYRRQIELMRHGWTDPFPAASIATRVIDNARRISGGPWLDDRTLVLGFDNHYGDFASTSSLFVFRGGDSLEPVTKASAPGRVGWFACSAPGQVGWREQPAGLDRATPRVFNVAMLQNGSAAGIEARPIRSWGIGPVDPFAWKASDGDWINPYSCVIQTDEFRARLQQLAPGDPNSRTVFPLRPGDGYLIADDDENLIFRQHWTHIAADLSSAVVLGLQRRSARLVWSAPESAYLVPTEDDGSLFADSPLTMTLFDPVRRALRTRDIQRSPLNETKTEYWPSAAGLLMLAAFWEPDGGDGPGALYVTTTAGPVRLYKGAFHNSLLTSLSVSPNGCAVTFEDWEVGTSPSKLVWIDLCAPENRTALAAAEREDRASHRSFQQKP